MSWGTGYLPEAATVTVSGSGRLGPDDVRRFSGEAGRLLRGKEDGRLLLDCSEASLDLRVLDVFYVPDCFEKAGMPRTARIALVLPAARQPMGVRRLYEFYETVCRNRGYTCRLFDCRESAELWLHRAG